jgi:DNA-binding NarL/FixJ family response regulator
LVPGAAPGDPGPVWPGQGRSGEHIGANPAVLDLRRGIRAAKSTPADSGKGSSGKHEGGAANGPWKKQETAIYSFTTYGPLIERVALSMKTSLRRTAVVLDQHPIWLEAVRSILERIGVEVLGTTTDVDEILELISTHHPDVLITSIELDHPNLDGIACLRLAGERQASLKTIVLSAYDDAEHIEAALAAGAIAYVLKTAHPDDFAAAIRQSFEHSVFMAGTHASPPSAETAEFAGDTRGLTRRELEILRLVAEGHSNAQLARMLWVTEQTVKFHLSNIYRKLDVSNRTEASRWAQVQGLLPANPSAVVA